MTSRIELPGSDQREDKRVLKTFLIVKKEKGKGREEVEKSSRSCLGEGCDSCEGERDQKTPRN